MVRKSKKINTGNIRPIQETTKNLNTLVNSAKSFAEFTNKTRDGAITIQQRIEPLFEAQKMISKSLQGFTHNINKSTLAVNNGLHLINQSIAGVEESLVKLTDFAGNAGILSSELTNDFISQPLSASASLFADNISLKQESILGLINSPKASTQLGNATAISGILKAEPLAMSGLAIDTLKESSFLFPGMPIVKETEENKRITKLEEDVEKLRRDKKERTENQFTKDVEMLLKKIDIELFQMFKGAYDVVGQTDDSLGQSAESMTRLLEKLPHKLSPKFQPKSPNKKESIREILADYLNINYENIKNIYHPLIDPQCSFYETFSQIRHRNVEIYSIYKKDPAQYKALLIQTEAFLYQVLSFKSSV